MKKSLQLQADMLDEYGACVFDVTLDCEDGAPVGGELEQAQLVAELAVNTRTNSLLRNPLVEQRVGARLHPVGHPAFAQDVEIVAGRSAAALSYIMIPKVESRADVEQAVAALDAVSQSRKTPLPVHVLIESPAAVQQAFAIAAHPRVESVSFGLMDFVSAHGGAIGSEAMTVRSAADTSTLDQFNHPLVVRAKLEIASACHASGKTPSHCVVTELRDLQALRRSAEHAARAFGYTRMWSIHPDQIRPVLQAFAPSAAQLEQAAQIIEAAVQQEWAPISVAGKLHDRASYRYFWQLLERAHQTGCTLPDSVRPWFAVDKF